MPIWCQEEQVDVYLSWRIILFDEATSALDNCTQEIVSHSLESMEATRIVIAHRLSTIQNADRVYVVEAGRVVEEGSYEELRRGGPFAMRKAPPERRRDRGRDVLRRRDARPPSATVKAQEDSTVFALTKFALNAKLAMDHGFATRFYRALAIYLSTTVRERHRALGGSGTEQAWRRTSWIRRCWMGCIWLERFDRMVKRVMVT